MVLGYVRFEHYFDRSIHRFRAFFDDASSPRASGRRTGWLVLAAGTPRRASTHGGGVTGDREHRVRGLHGSGEPSRVSRSARLRRESRRLGDESVNVSRLPSDATSVTCCGVGARGVAPALARASIRPRLLPAYLPGRSRARAAPPPRARAAPPPRARARASADGERALYPRRTLGRPRTKATPGARRVAARDPRRRDIGIDRWARRRTVPGDSARASSPTPAPPRASPRRLRSTFPASFVVPRLPPSVPAETPARVAMANSVNILLGVGPLCPSALRQGGWAASGVLAKLGLMTELHGEGANPLPVGGISPALPADVEVARRERPFDDDDDDPSGTRWDPNTVAPRRRPLMTYEEEYLAEVWVRHSVSRPGQMLCTLSSSGRARSSSSSRAIISRFSSKVRARPRVVPGGVRGGDGAHPVAGGSPTAVYGYGKAQSARWPPSRSWVSSRTNSSPSEVSPEPSPRGSRPPPRCTSPRYPCRSGSWRSCPGHAVFPGHSVVDGDARGVRGDAG